MENAPFTLLAAQSALGIYGAIYVGASIFAPNWFLNNLAVNHIQRRRRFLKISPDEPWWLWLCIIVTILAVGVLVYVAVYAVVAIIPYDWGGHNEDGEWESLRYSVQMGMGSIGGICLVDRLEKNAEILVWGPQERKARQVATEAIGHAVGIAPELRQKIAASAERNLGSDEIVISGDYEADYARDVSRCVRASIRG